jgi:hypothetical protein
VEEEPPEALVPAEAESPGGVVVVVVALFRWVQPGVSSKSARRCREGRKTCDFMG